MAAFTRRSILTAAMGTAALSMAGGARDPALSTTPPDEEITPGERRAMASIADRYLQEYGARAVSVAVARTGRLVYAEGFGVSGEGTDQKVTPSSLFRIASVSKPFTSVTIFSLIEQNRLSLDDKVFGPGGVLHAEFGAHASRPYVADITVEHLLTHTAGGWSIHRSDPMFMNPRMNHRELINWTLANLPLTNPPGAAFAYSNFGYCILGRVIEKVAQSRYDTFVQHTVLDRCGVTDMRIGRNSAAERLPGEVVYVRTDSADDPYGMNVTRMDSHAGWIATASDLVRFIVHVDARSEPARLLRPETIRLMTEPSAANARYAKGWMINGNNYFHNGGLPGTSAIMVRTQIGLCWAALANARHVRPDSVGGIDRMAWNMVRSVKSWAA